MKASALLALFAMVAAACGSSTSTSTGSAPASSAPTGTTASVSLGTRTLPGVGTILVDARGRTLYTFAPDKGQKVTCVSSCAAIWPPLSISSGTAALGAGLHASMVGSDPNPAGGRVVTYAGWPLYTYVSDTNAGTDNGQAINQSGGVWHVISPAGTVVTKKASSGGTTTTHSSGY